MLFGIFSFMNRKKSLNFTHSHQKLQNFVDFDTAQKQQKHFSNRETTVTIRQKVRMVHTSYPF